MPHHENTPTFEATFKKDKSTFIEAFLELGNPFQENANHLIHITSKHVLDESAANSVSFKNWSSSIWKEYNVTPSQYKIQLKRTIFCYFEAKTTLSLIGLNKRLLVCKLNAVYMQTCM